MEMWWADNSVKNWQNFPISNPKPELHNINAHTKFGQNPLVFIQVTIWKWNTDGHMYDSRMDGLTHTHPTWNIIHCHYPVVGYNKKSLFILEALWLPSVT